MEYNKKFSKNRGFIKITIIIVGLLVLLKYTYELDVIGFLTEGRFKELLDRFYSLGQKGWSEYKETIIKLMSVVREWLDKLIDKIKK